MTVLAWAPARAQASSGTSGDQETGSADQSQSGSTTPQARPHEENYGQHHSGWEGSSQAPGTARDPARVRTPDTSTGSSDRSDRDRDRDRDRDHGTGSGSGSSGSSSSRDNSGSR